MTTVSDSDLIVLSKPGCVQCNAVYTRLDAAGVDYEVIDVSQDPVWFDKLIAQNIKSAPVTMRRGDDPKEWVLGFDPDGLDRLF